MTDDGPNKWQNPDGDPDDAGLAVVGLCIAILGLAVFCLCYATGGMR